MKRALGAAVLLAAVIAGCGNAVPGPGPGPGTGPFDSGPSGTRCAAVQTDCNGVCVNIATDTANCGGCGVACGGGAVCSGGACVTRQPTCPNPQILCGGACVNALTDNANCGACGTACSGRSSCRSGSCVEPVPDPCGPSAPNGTCPTGQFCVGGACCSQPCGAVCCSTGSTCVRDGSGNLSCARRCQSSSECASAGGCCATLYNDAGRDVGYGACLTPTPGVTYCRCSTQSECGSNAGCTPLTDSNRVPTGPFVCTALGCAPYQRCTGILGSCPNGYCNLCDSAGRCYCAQVCASDAQCGGARCVTYGQSIGSCPANQRACAP